MKTGPYLIMTAAFLWALDALIRTQLSKQLSSVEIVLFEHFVGLFILLPFFWPVKKLIAKIKPADLFTIIILSVISSVMGTLFFTRALSLGITTGDFVTPVLVQKLQPIIVIIFAVLLLKERFIKGFAFLSATALIGSYLMSFGFKLPLYYAPRSQVFLLALGAAASWGFGTILSRKLLLKYPVSLVTFLRFFIAVFICLIYMILIKQKISLDVFTEPEIFYRFLLIAFTTGAGALLIYYRGLAKTPAHVATFAELIFPFTSIIIALTKLNPYGSPQNLSLENAFGLALLLFSVIYISIIYANRLETIVLTGKVIKGKGDGKKMGFPTANIKPENIPKIRFGVYAVCAEINGKKYNGVLHYGPRATFGESHPQWEVHFLDFKNDIYGKKITIRFKGFIRGTKYMDILDLPSQIRQDIKSSKQYFSNIS